MLVDLTFILKQKLVLTRTLRTTENHIKDKGDETKTFHTR